MASLTSLMSFWEASLMLSSSSSTTWRLVVDPESTAAIDTIEGDGDGSSL